MQHSKAEALEAFRTLGQILQDVYGVDREELLRETGITIPSSVFRTGLSPLSAVASYLSSKGIEEKKIAKLLNRNRTYIRQSIKPATFKEGGSRLPIDIFSGKLSILEAAVTYLKNKGLDNSEIAEELDRSVSAVWTLVKRAEEKLGGGR